ncbi:HERC1, partial [Symbiodinium sp. KB8]
VCIGLHLPFVSCALLLGVELTCTASNLAGLWAYEAWRAGKQDALEVLARMAHPDKNRRHDAKTTFALLRLCKEALGKTLAGHQSTGHIVTINKKGFRGMQRLLAAGLNDIQPEWKQEGRRAFSKRQRLPSLMASGLTLKRLFKQEDSMAELSFSLEQQRMTTEDISEHSDAAAETDAWELR